MEVGIYGAGKWGIAIDYILKHNVKTKISSRNYRNLDNFVELDELLKLDYIAISISSAYIKEFLDKIKVEKRHRFLITSKGIDLESASFISDILKQYTSIDNVAFISGPSFSSEVLQSKPIALGIFSTNEDLAKKVYSLFKTSFIKPYISDDIIGAQVSGAYKNIISIASGIAYSMDLGDSARASLVARGLVEMNRFGSFYGAKIETFLGVSGAGDLFLTSNSKLSRNFRLGIELSKNISLKEAILNIKETAEGVNSAYAINKMAKMNNIYTPIVSEVVNVLNGKDTKKSLYDLLSS